MTSDVDLLHYSAFECDDNRKGVEEGGKGMEGGP